MAKPDQVKLEIKERYVLRKFPGRLTAVQRKHAVPDEVIVVEGDFITERWKKGDPGSPPN